MGKVSDYILTLIARQLDDKGIVVWYDPGKVYTDFVDQLEVPDATILKFEGSFLRLRHEMEPFLEFIDRDGKPCHDCEVPPRLLVYVPMDRRDTEYALVEAEVAGALLEPGAQPWQRNTRLRVVAEHVFKKIAPDRVDEIARQVEKGLLSLEELDKVAAEVISVGTATIKLTFGTVTPVDVALMFAASDEHDEAIQGKQAAPELGAFFREELGISVGADSTLQEARKDLWRGLLMTEFLSGLPDEARPDAFSSIAIPDDPKHIDAVRSVCDVWRNRLDLRETYADAAREIEKEMGLGAVDVPAEALTDLHTFSAFEKKLLGSAEQMLLSGQCEKALYLAAKRKVSFWSLQEPTLQLHWHLVENGARVLTLGERIRTDIKKAKNDPVYMVRSYVEGDEPWSLLDTYYRHLEHQYSLFDLELTGDHEDLQRLIAHVRQYYTETVEQCVESFVRALVSSDFRIEGFLPQGSIWAQHLLPQVAQGEKTAYFLVDALRFEMGRELTEGLTDDFEVSVQAGIAQLPTITSVGMASLMPGAQQGIELVQAGGKLAVSVGSSTLKNRSARLAYLAENIEVPATFCKLSELIKPSKKRQKEIKDATLVVVTSQELDRWGEEGEGEDEVRIFMDEVLDKLRKAIRRLATLGVSRFVVTADHGHLFGEAFEGGLKMDAPGGEALELHSRVWVGRGGKTGEGFHRIPASQLGLGGDLELAFPRGLASFKAKGGTGAYCHGGISLQEMVIPIILLTPKRKLAFKTATVRLEAAKPRITTRFFSVTATYAVEGLFGAEEIRVKLVVRAKRKEIGFAAMASYGFEEGTREIVLEKDRSNPITLMLTDTRDVKTASVHVLDAVSQVEIARLDNIQVAIAI